MFTSSERCPAISTTGGLVAGVTDHASVVCLALREAE
jgi:hypothetical protein